MLGATVRKKIANFGLADGLVSAGANEQGSVFHKKVWNNQLCMLGCFPALFMWWNGPKKLLHSEVQCASLRQYPHCH